MKFEIEKPDATKTRKVSLRQDGGDVDILVDGELVAFFCAEGKLIHVHNSEFKPRWIL